MKKIILIASLALLSACNFSYSVDKDTNGHVHRETTEKSPGKDIKIKMEGVVSFNADKTEITGISEGGYIEYRNNDISIEIRPESKGVNIEISDDGQTIAPGSDKGKKHMAIATERIIALQEEVK